MVLFSKGSELAASLVGPGAGICSPDDPNAPCGSRDGSPRRAPALSPPSSHFSDQIRAPGSSEGKESGSNAGDLGSIPGSRRSPGEGNGYPLLAWRIPWTEKMGGLQSKGSQSQT